VTIQGQKIRLRRVQHELHWDTQIASHQDCVIIIKIGKDEGTEGTDRVLSQRICEACSSSPSSVFCVPTCLCLVGRRYSSVYSRWLRRPPKSVLAGTTAHLRRLVSGRVIPWTVCVRNICCESVFSAPLPILFALWVVQSVEHEPSGPFPLQLSRLLEHIIAISRCSKYRCESVGTHSFGS
jgi:hypothetical protein